MLLTLCPLLFVAFARTDAISCAATGSRYTNHICTGATYCTSSWYSEYQSPNNWTLSSRGCVLTSYKNPEKAGWRHFTTLALYTCYTDMCNTLAPPKVFSTFPPTPTSTSPPAITCWDTTYTPTPGPGGNGTANCTGNSCEVQKWWAGKPNNDKPVKKCGEMNKNLIITALYDYHSRCP